MRARDEFARSHAACRRSFFYTYNNNPSSLSLSLSHPAGFFLRRNLVISIRRFSAPWDINSRVPRDFLSAAARDRADFLRFSFFLPSFFSLFAVSAEKTAIPLRAAPRACVCWLLSSRARAQFRYIVCAVCVCADRRSSSLFF